MDRCKRTERERTCKTKETVQLKADSSFGVLSIVLSCGCYRLDVNDKYDCGWVSSLNELVYGFLY